MDDGQDNDEVESAATKQIPCRQDTEAREEIAPKGFVNRMSSEYEDANAEDRLSTRPSELPSNESALSRFKDYLTDYRTGFNKQRLDDPPRSPVVYNRTTFNPKATLISQDANTLGLRRDLDKTKRAIERDKFNKTTDEIVRKSETGLVPPGTETEIYVSSPVARQNSILGRLSASQPDTVNSADNPSDRLSVRYGNPRVDGSRTHYSAVDRMSRSFSSSEGDGPSNKKFFVENEYHSDEFDEELSLNERYARRNDMRRGNHRNHCSSKEFNYRVQRHSYSNSPDRRVSPFNSKKQYPLDESNSMERRPRQRQPSGSRDRLNSKERLSNEDIRSRDRYKYLRRSRDADQRHDKRGRVYLRPEIFKKQRTFKSPSRERVCQERFSKSTDVRSSRMDRHRFRKSVSREKQLKKNILPLKLPLEQFQNDAPIGYSSIGGAVASSGSFPYQSAASTAPAYSSFGWDYTPPMLNINPATSYVYPTMYNEPKPLISTPIQPLFCPPPQQIRMPPSALAVPPMPVPVPAPIFNQYQPNIIPVKTMPAIHHQSDVKLQAVTASPQSNNKIIALSSIPALRLRKQTLQEVSINENSIYDTQRTSVQFSMTAKERQNIEDVIKRCMMVIEKLEYLHLPNRIYCPTFKRRNPVELKFTSPIIHEAVTYDFTTKSLDKEKSFLAASIASTLDLHLEEISIEPSVTAAKYKNKAVQTTPFSCDQCTVNTLKSATTSMDVAPPPSPPPPSPPPPNLPRAPVSLMYLTPANILNPSYGAPPVQHTDSQAFRNYHDTDDFDSRRLLYGNHNTGNAGPRMSNPQVLGGRQTQINPNHARLPKLMDIRRQYEMYDYNNYNSQ